MKKIISLILCFLLIFSIQTISFAGPSTWAFEGVFSAQYDGLVEGELLSLNKFNDRINRAEFAEIIVKLYAEAQGIGVDTLSKINPFTDTDNEYVAMAYNLGIVGGKGEGIYAPFDNVKREEMAVMMVRMLKALGYPIGNYAASPYDDRWAVDSWAIEAVDFCYHQGIMSGVGNNLFDPLNNASRQQAIVLSDKLAKRYGWIDSYDENFYGNTDNFRTLGDYSVPKRELAQVTFYQKDGNLFMQSKGIVSMGIELNMKDQHRMIYNTLLQHFDYALASEAVEKMTDLWDPVKKSYREETVYISSTGIVSMYAPTGSYVKLVSDKTLTLEAVK